MTEIHVVDRSDQPPAPQPARPSASDVLAHRERKVTYTGLAVLARRHCANFKAVCGNCRLCNHRRVRCSYFERAVLPGLDLVDAELYAAGFDVAVERLPGGKPRVRVAPWDVLVLEGNESTRAA